MKCVNFKVRINGAAALAVPTKRAHYGRFYLSVWSALSVALYQANQLTDFNEYNHRDNLLDQVSFFFVQKMFSFDLPQFLYMKYYFNVFSTALYHNIQFNQTGNQ